MTVSLPDPINRYVSAANSFDLEGVMGAFSDDALVNDIQREFRGADAIRGWAAKELVGDKVTMDVTASREHHGNYILDAQIDGEYDKTGLPDPLVLTYYFTVDEGWISQLIILSNRPA